MDAPIWVPAEQQLAERFSDIIYADEQLLRAEFDAIIAAEWPDPPPPGRFPAAATPHSTGGSDGCRGRPAAAAVGAHAPAGAEVWGRPRSPPSNTLKELKHSEGR
jgi:hypothetical protein